MAEEKQVTPPPSGLIAIRIEDPGDGQGPLEIFLRRPTLGELNFMRIQAMGQAVNARIGVEETKVRVEVMLPGMLGMFAGAIEAMLQKKGNVLLEDHSKG